MSSQLLSQQESTELTAWVHLLRGHRGLTGELNAGLLEEHGLTINDYEVLLLLSRAEEGRLRRVDLAESVRLTPSGITRLLAGLEKHGYVERAFCDTDARVTYAVLTDAGRTKLEDASGSHLEAIRAALAERYSPEELETLAELLSRLPGTSGSLAC
jgi:DNA-binding MarR family transcriptional regulator